MQKLYCAYCGGTMIHLTENVSVCSVCQKKVFLNPVPSAGLIIENEHGQILLAKRKKEPGKGFWGVPGGFLDPGESLEEAAEREIKEEIHVDIKVQSYIGSFPSTYLYQKTQRPVIVVFFSAYMKGFIPNVENEEICELRFFDHSSIPFEQLAFSEHREAVRAYLQKRIENNIV